MSRVNILSIDSGGIHGVNPTTILIELEELIQSQAGCKNRTIADSFDIITSKIIYILRRVI